MKKCNVCNVEKKMSSFDKYRKTCRKCRNKKNTTSYLLKEGNKEKIRDYQRDYQKKHRMNNTYYQIYCKCLSQLNTKTDLSLRKHLESLFTKEMTWENYGTYWEIDHIISATKMAKAGYSVEEINKLSNLRPLSKKENREREKNC